MIRSVYLATSLAMVVLGPTGCATIEKVSGDIKGATDSVQKATENVKIGAEALSQGLKGLDPLGLNSLINSNKELRDRLEAVQIALTKVERNTLTINPTNSKLRLTIDGVSGTLVVSGWVDQPENFFCRTIRYVGKAPILQFGHTLAADSFDLVVQKARATEAAQPVMLRRNLTDDSTMTWKEIRKLMEEVDTSYTSKVAEAFGAYLTNPLTAPATPTSTHYIHERLVTPGLHRVYLRVRPTVTDAGGKWELRYRLVHERAGNADVDVFQGTLDSQMDPVKLGEAIDVLVGTLFVSQPDPPSP